MTVRDYVQGLVPGTKLEVAFQGVVEAYPSGHKYVRVTTDTPRGPRVATLGENLASASWARIVGTVWDAGDVVVDRTGETYVRDDKGSWRGSDGTVSNVRDSSLEDFTHVIRGGKVLRAPL